VTIGNLEKGLYQSARQTVKFPGLLGCADLFVEETDNQPARPRFGSGVEKKQAAGAPALSAVTYLL
jgi:hypothetical protein